MASRLTSTPAPTAVAMTRCRRSVVVTPLTAMRYKAKATIRRPVMWSALAWAAGASAAARPMAASTASQADVSGVRHTGHFRDHAVAQSHAASTPRIRVSRFVIDCQRRRTSGRLNSNGARSTSAQVAAYATPAAGAADRVIDARTPVVVLSRPIIAAAASAFRTMFDGSVGRRIPRSLPRASRCIRRKARVLHRQPEHRRSFVSKQSAFCCRHEPQSARRHRRAAGATRV